MKTVFPHPVCPQIIAEWGLYGRSISIECADKPAILYVQLCICHDIQVYVQSASHPSLLGNLDGDALTGILNVPAAAMELVVVGHPEVEP